MGAHVAVLVKFFVTLTAFDVSVPRSKAEFNDGELQHYSWTFNTLPILP